MAGALRGALALACALAVCGASSEVARRASEQKIRYVPWRGGQTEWHLHDARIKILVAGARSGKSLAATADTCDRAITQVGYDPIDRAQGIPYTIAVGAPDYPQIRRVILPLMLRSIPKKLITSRYNESQHLLKLRGLRGETWIYFLSARNPETWQGQELYGVWLDEFTQMPELMFDEAQTRLSTRDGWMLLTGTPKGPNWAKERIYDPACAGKFAPEDVFFESWKTADSPYFPRAKLARLRQTMPAKYFRRTYEAAWDVFEGQIYDEYAEDVHARERRDYRFVLPDGRTMVGAGAREVRLEKTYAGVDWGFNNPGAIAVVGRAGAQWWGLDESYGSGILVTSPVATQDTWVARARALCQRWQVDTFFADPEAPEYIAQFRAAKIPTRQAKNEVHPGIEAVAELLHVDPATGEPRLVFLRDLRRTLGEIVYYHWKVSKLTGRSTEEPERIDDHLMSALRYALYSAITLGRFQRQPHYAA